MRESQKRFAQVLASTIKLQHILKYSCSLGRYGAVLAKFLVFLEWTKVNSNLTSCEKFQSY